MLNKPIIITINYLLTDFVPKYRLMIINNISLKEVKNMFKYLYITLFIAAALACKAAPKIQDDVPGSSNLKPDAQQSQIAKTISELIVNYNYKKVDLNDSVSGVIYTNYLKALDPNRVYFLAADIKSFDKYKNTFDEDLENGDLAGAFYIFNVYQKRYTERINYSIKELSKSFDYNKNESYNFDREKQPYFASVKQSDENWEKRVKYDLLNLKISGLPEAKNKESVKKRYDNLLLQSNKINNQDVFRIFMNAFTAAVDPHTNYFNNADAANFNIDMSRSLEGIGATLASENEFVTIKSIVPGGPADKSKKLAIDDKIVGVAQGTESEFTDVIGWRLDNAIALIRGKKGTIVRLKVLSKSQDVSASPKIVQMVREKIVLQDQSAKKTIKTINDNGKSYKIGVIEIPAFYADFKAYQAGDPNYKSTTRDVKLILDSLKNDQVQGVIIDLRTNGGGSLMEAIELTGLFIKTGPVVQVRDGKNKVSVEKDNDASVTWDGPMAVLVDRFSASASEIFAGAIQDYRRGLILGTQTYGKGTVQTAIDMIRVNPDLGDKSGQINLTTGKFYRISGSSTQHKGVTPDIEFPMIFPADKYGESAEPSALPWDTIKPSAFSKTNNVTVSVEELKKLHEQRMAQSKEYKFLLDDIALFKKKQEERTISLNEAALKKQRDAEENATFKRENERRLLHGYPALIKDEAKPAKEDTYDFIEDESLHILADFISKK